ncbi:MAG: hypothetical protein AAB481_01880 [Patescibacteria group bacterium]
MLGQTLETRDWVGESRESLRKLGVPDPEKYVDQAKTAVAMSMLIARHLLNDISVPKEEDTRSWLQTQGIEPTDILIKDILAEHERLYYDGVFRDGVLQVLYNRP